nr:NADH dehydrogenase subunit 6 [Pseudocapillaria tomentosa]
MSLILLMSFLYILFSHPLMMSLLVFLISIVISFSKFYQMNSNNLYVYLFIMVYSGGLLLMLVYMSSLVPNFNMSMKLSLIMILIFLTIFSVYTEKYFCFFSNNNFLNLSFSVITFILNYKEMFYLFIFLLMLIFCFLASMMNLFKYPIRSL